MKRLLGLTGLTCFAVLAACFYMIGLGSLYLSIGAFVLFVVCMFFKKMREDKTFLVTFLTVAVSALFFWIYTVNVYLPITLKYSGAVAEVKAVQKVETYTCYGLNVYELEVKEINSERVNTRLKLMTKGTLFSEPNDTLEFKCELDKVTSKAYLSENVFLKATLFDDSEVVVTHPQTKPLSSYIYDLRSTIRRGLYMELDKETADFASAVLIGDKHSLTEEVTELLRLNGLSHVSVVSGLHLSIIVSLCFKCISKVTKKRWIIFSVTVAVMLLYAAITGFTIPVRRSMLMFLFLLIGKLIGRLHDPVNSIGAAALVILVFSPYSAGNIGMLLSFSATLGIVLWMERMSEYLFGKVKGLYLVEHSPCICRLVRGIIDVVSTSVCAVVCTLPVSLLCFGGFSTVTVISNLLVVPLMTVAIVAMALCSALHYVRFIPYIAEPFAFAVTVIYRWIVFVCRLFGGIPFSYVQADAVYCRIALSAALLIIAIAIIIGKKRVYVLAAVLSVVMLTGSVLANNIVKNNTVTLRLPDTNNGMTVVLESTDGNALLMIGGSRTRVDSLCDYMSELDGGGCDVLIDTAERYSEIYYTGLTESFDYQTILRYDNGRNIGADDNNVKTFDGKTRISLWDKAEVMLIPVGGSVFEYIVAGNTTVLIVPEYGDAGLLSSEYTSPDIIVTRGICSNMDILESDKLIVVGSDYKAYASSVISGVSCNEVIRGTDIRYDIDITV